MQLRLIVNNPGNIDGGAKSSAVFDVGGGVIGSDLDADWFLADRQATVSPHHLKIIHLDGQFCLEVGDGATIYVNGSTTPIESHEIFQIADGDEVRLGTFTLSAYINDNESKISGDGSINNDYVERDWSRRFAPVGVLVGDEQTQNISSQALFDTEIMQREDHSLKQRLSQAIRNDPIEMIEEKQSSRSTNEKDPMTVFEREHNLGTRDMMMAKVSEVLNIEPEEAHYVELPDDFQPGSNYVHMPAPHTSPQAFNNVIDDDNPPNGHLFDFEHVGETQVQSQSRAQKGKRPLERDDVDSYLEMLAQAARTPTRATDNLSHPSTDNSFYGTDWQRVADASHRDSYLGGIENDEIGEIEGSVLVDHVVLRPLCAALGLQIAHLSQPQANRLAHEIGQALHVAISGLMAIHSSEIAGKSHLSQTHLHAIEDNPLRLDISVEDALRDMFLVQSPVHLSASAAIGESLELLAHHRAANNVATEIALETILQALSPLALARRFMKYKGHAPRAGDLDAWHWNMYQHYYAEMRSSQQGGLSRMFWEIHHQIYDREMRLRTQEQD